MNSASPYISFIGFARNDDYIPDRAERHNFSLNFLLQQLKDYEIPSEIILVEWNYSEDRPPLAETIKLTVETKWTTVRVIRVPPKFHQRYKHWQVKPFHVGAAINVGVQRAKGKFILPIASDVFLTNACLKKIAQQDLDENSFYRCDRYDVDAQALENFTGDRDNFLRQCANHIKVHHSYIQQESSFQIENLHTNGSGDFYLTSKNLLQQIRGSKEGKDVGAFDIDSLIVHALNGLGAKQILLSNDCRVYKVFHNKSTSRAVEQVWEPWQNFFEKTLCRLRCSSLIINNFRIIFNYPKRRYSYAPQVCFDSFENNFLKYARRWAKKTPPFYLNDESWGLKGEILDEQLINKTLNKND